MEELNEMISEFLNDEIYDMMDEFSDDDVVEAVGRAVRGMRIFGVFSLKLGGYRFKMSNYNKSVSCSTDDCTGVSRTEFKVYWEEEESDGSTYNPDGVKNVIEMMNEAYYHCIS